MDYLPSNKKRLVYHQPVEALNPQLLINNEPSIFKGALLPYAFMIINESEIIKNIKNDEEHALLFISIHFPVSIINKKYEQLLFR